MKTMIRCSLLAYLIMSLTLFPVTSCTSRKTPVTVYPKDEFAIYFLADVPENNITPPDYSDLEHFQLKPDPWITLNDIDYYDFSTQLIYLNNEDINLKPNWDKPFIYTFIVIARGERIYLGHIAFRSPRTWPASPEIILSSNFPDDIVAVSALGMERVVNMANDQRIKDVFIASGKYQAGLKVDLGEVHIVDRSAAYTVSYSFTVTNEGDKPLYVPDPVKMGDQLFSSYINGVALRGVGMPISVYPNLLFIQGKSVPSYYEWTKDWYTKLDPGKTMTRTVIREEYPFIVPGTYNCDFTYSGPNNVAKENRTIDGAQIWLGDIKSSSLRVEITY